MMRLGERGRGPSDGAAKRHDGQLREAVKDCPHSSVNTGKEG